MLTGIYRADFEPTLPAEPHPVLDDLAVDLVAASSSLAGLMHPMVRGGVGDLVRSMNCYYSNLIEGHNTVPRDIERALAAEYSTDNPKKRDLQREAVAHIEVQRLIDLGHDDLSSPVSTEYLRWLHREFCKRLPEDLLWVENPETGERVRVVPGEIRERGVAVGIHVPPPESQGCAAALSSARCKLFRNGRGSPSVPDPPSQDVVDSSVLGWKWKGGETDVAFDVPAAGDWQQLVVGVTGSCAERHRVQAPADGRRRSSGERLRRAG